MKPKIMLVEDEAVVALNLRMTLARLGYDVLGVAASFEQAVKRASETNPDLVLMDINISGDKDGIEAAAAIKAPVIYLTAYAEQSTLDRAKKTAPYGYLLKPYSDRELHATLQMALERCRVEHELADSQQRLTEAYMRVQETKDQLEIHANELFQQKEKLLVTLKAIGDGVVTTDDAGRITFINPAAEEMTGWVGDAAQGELSSTVLKLRDADTNAPLPSPIETVLVSGRCARLPDNCALLHQDGSTRLVELSAAPVRDRDARTMGAVLVFHDVSAARRMAAEMTYQATHDGLTGLFNRLEFERRLGKLLAGTDCAQTTHCVIFFDLDQFKIVNDTCGHAAGDELLRKVARLMRAPLRASDCLARLGGDEFVVLLESCPQSVALRLANTIKQSINEFHFVWQDRVFPIGVSGGLVQFGGEGSPPLEMNEILRLADSACYSAKEAGRNTIHTYRPDDALLARIHDEMDWYGRIHRALLEDHFVLFAQEIRAFRPENAYARHYEILLRLRDASGRIIPPMAFVPAAERYGQMRLIDRWVIRNALAMIAGTGSSDDSLFSINLSGCSMNDETLLAFIDEQFALTGVSPQSICFEITETAAITNILTASAFIATLRAKGCLFALDDFGSGMASFCYLKHLKVDFLKIDGSFVRDMANSAVDTAMVQAINGIGHIMGMKTIAEFVENDELATLLTVQGVDYGQGYGLARPAPLADILHAT